VENRKQVQTMRFWTLAWVALLCTTSVRADVSPADKAAAEALFDRGLTLLRSGKYAEACTRLEESQAIDRGIGTMLYLADCYEKLGRTASAWAMFREASSLAAAAGQAERADAGKRRAAQLEPRLSTLNVQVPSESRVPGLEVLHDGRSVPEGIWASPCRSIRANTGWRRAHRALRPGVPRSAWRPTRRTRR
jgi:hypothetical protein